MTTNTGTYREEPPESFEAAEKSWDELGYSAQYYHYNKDNRNQIKYNKNIRHRNSNFVDRVKDDRTCVVCGEDYNACLDFHHLSNKEYNIGTMVSNGHSLESIADEMEKCTILCANCHRKYHDGRFDDVEFEQLSVDLP